MFIIFNSCFINIMLLNIWGMCSVMDISVKVLVIMLFVLKVWNKEKLIGTKFFGVNSCLGWIYLLLFI